MDVIPGKHKCLSRVWSRGEQDRAGGDGTQPGLGSCAFYHHAQHKAWGREAEGATTCFKIQVLAAGWSQPLSITVPIFTVTWGAIRSHPHIVRLCWLGLKNKRNLFKLRKCLKRKQTELAVFMLSAWGGIFSLQCYTKRKCALRHIPSRAPAAQQRFCRLCRDVNAGIGPFSQSWIHSLPWARTKLPKTDRAVPKSPNPTPSRGAASLSGEA